MTTFSTGNHYLRVIASSETGDEGELVITARNASHVTSACLAHKAAPAFALAVLEAAGYTADNSCAGDAVRSLKYQIANEARAAEEAELHKEAVFLCNKVVGLPFEAQAPAMNVEHWTKIARAARELHKTETGADQA